MADLTDNAPPATPLAPTLAVRDLARRHGTHTVFHGLNLRREHPGVVGIVGANGSGKTSLLRIVAQLLVPSAGSINVCGRAVTRGDDRGARRLVGYVPHEPLAYGARSVRANLDYALQLAGVRSVERAARVEHEIELWSLESVADHAVATLSRGWKQRYSLARGDLLTPPLLLLDEPTVALDAAGRTLLDAAIARWAAERIVLVSSHERGWLDGVADVLVDLELHTAGPGTVDPFAHEVFA